MRITILQHFPNFIMHTGLLGTLERTAADSGLGEAWQFVFADADAAGHGPHFE